MWEFRNPQLRKSARIIEIGTANDFNKIIKNTRDRTTTSDDEPGLTVSARIVLAGSSSEAERYSQDLADEFGWPVSKDCQFPQPNQEEIGECLEFILRVFDDRLELLNPKSKQGGALSVDFQTGAIGHRVRSIHGRRQPLGRALGLRTGTTTVLDATAGLGRDAFVLACMGCDVLAVERCAVLGVLLRDGLKRAQNALNERVKQAASCIDLVIDDARSVMQKLEPSEAPDAVYLDPMFPPSNKSALSKKEIRFCRQLVGDDSDAGDLLQVALRVARKRVVVKRHRHAPQLAPNVALEFGGRTIRYDVYWPVK